MFVGWWEGITEQNMSFLIDEKVLFLWLVRWSVGWINGKYGINELGLNIVSNTIPIKVDFGYITVYSVV